MALNRETSGPKKIMDDDDENLISGPGLEEIDFSEDFHFEDDEGDDSSREDFEGK